MQASTIHRLLQWSPQAGGFTKCQEDPLDADVVLVDESSMIPIGLMQALKVIGTWSICLESHG